MNNMEIVSVFRVTDYKTKEIFKEVIDGVGQEPAAFIRREYPRFSKIVLKGWEIGGKFVPLKLR